MDSSTVATQESVVQKAPSAADAKTQASSTPKVETLSLLDLIAQSCALASDRAKARVDQQKLTVELTFNLSKAELAELELKLAEAVNKAREASAAPASAPDKKSLVLLVEDDLVCRCILKRILEHDFGCQVVEASNGKIAWDLLADGLVPDLCLSDISMPQMSGLELLENIRNTPGLKQLKVVFCTAVSEVTMVKKAAVLRVANYILKPYSKDKVIAQLKLILSPPAPVAATVTAEAVPA